MTTDSSVARSAAVVRAVADGAMPSSVTARAAASLRAVGILIEVLDVPSSLPSRSSPIRSMTAGTSTQNTVPQACGTVLDPAIYLWFAHDRVDHVATPC